MFTVAPVWIFLTLIVAGSVEGLCRYRNIGDLPPEIFSYWADWGCYTYTRPDLFAGVQLQASQCYTKYNNTQYAIPGLIWDEKCIPFSHDNETIKKSVERTFHNPETVQRWIRCCLDAEICCKNIMMKSEAKEGLHCPSTWDGWSCFDDIPAGNVYSQVCSQYAYTNKPPQCHHYSSKVCYPNGTWQEQTDYSACDITPRLIFRTLWHMAVLSISIAVCIPAIAIMAFYPTLHTEKLAMVRNLLIILVLRNFFVIIVKGTLILDELTEVGPTLMGKNNWPCRMLSVLEKFFGTAVFTCMLMEGVYLYQMLTNVFRARLRGGLRTTELYVIGFAVTTGVTLAWSLAMALNEKKHCWQVTEGTDFHWIFDGPRLAMLVVNFGLLVRIVYALWSTFNLRQEEQHPAFRTAKAALICLPLFGVPFLLLVVRPDTNDCAIEQFYYTLYYTVEALQGILIAILHCYSEREVKAKFFGKIKWLKQKSCDLFSKRDQRSSSESARRRRPISEISRSSTSRSSIQSRRESETTASTLTTPQVENKERFSFQLPRIQEDDERNISSGSNSNKSPKHRLSIGNMSISSTAANLKQMQDQLPRRHSADETEAGRSEEFFSIDTQGTIS
ncbi:unnamed protein product [Hermetia illucens]|uniref:Uncharacterized protein n=1 Tax=Hermetia illucens TaxID=343691 RepID=A0A7R8YZ26_HERIL|nr:calcitonin receptor-like isoform X2 [Hermetia illucens]CAD7090050.1 unnamed protein product [Hermetia illucens]